MYRKATKDDIPGIVRLWQEAFHEMPVLPDGTCFVAEVDGQIAAMLHALPQTLRGKTDHKAYYLYAVATRESLRGRGLCRGLMAYAEDALDADCTMLVPAAQSLFDFYERLGYETCFYRKKTPFCGGEEISMEQYLALREPLLPMPHVVYDNLSYAQKIYDLKFYKTPTGICAASQTFTAETLPEDTGGTPYGMVKWRRNKEDMTSAYLGFGLE